MKTINVTEDTKEQLAKIGNVDDSYEDVIKRLIDEAGYGEDF